MVRFCVRINERGDKKIEKRKFLLLNAIFPRPHGGFLLHSL